MATDDVRVSLGILVSILCFHAQQLRGEVQAPCYGCRLFNLLHQQHPETDKKETVWCHYPCQCPMEELRCAEGVSVIKDGCGCCYMCARQQGDMCSPNARCDEVKELHCQKDGDNHTGICKSQVQNPCLVDGVLYKDGEQFQPDCARTCTCQNGFYGCVTKCPQESKPPSGAACLNPQLLPVVGKCCKEWTCLKMEASEAGGSLLDGTRGLESQALILQRPLWYMTTTTETTTTTTSTVRPYCHVTTTEWSPCSVTCDAGMSVRIVTDPSTCTTRQDRRICFLRPCGPIVETHGRSTCTPTTRSGTKAHVRFQDCISLRQYRLKWCTTCRRERCCYPKRTRTRFMKFECTGGVRETMQFMWIKKCRCDSRCYREDRNRKRGFSRRQEQGKKRRQRWHGV